MKYTNNPLALFAITGAYTILSFFFSFTAVYSIFRPEKFQDLLLLFLLLLLFFITVNIIAEIIVCLKARRFATIVLDEEQLAVACNFKRKKSGKIKYNHIKYTDITDIDFDFGFVPWRFANKDKCKEPSVTLLGDGHKRLYTLKNPSLRMLFRLKRKCPNAKLSHSALWYLLLPAGFAVLFVVFFAIAL